VLSLEESLFEWVGLLIRAIILMVFKSVFFGFSYPRNGSVNFGFYFYLMMPNCVFLIWKLHRRVCFALLMCFVLVSVDINLYCNSPR